MQFLTVKQAAEKLMLSERTVHYYMEKGWLTKYRGPEGSDPIRLSKDEVENFFKPEADVTSASKQEKEPTE